MQGINQLARTGSDQKDSSLKSAKSEQGISISSPSVSPSPRKVSFKVPSNSGSGSSSGGVIRTSNEKTPERFLGYQEVGVSGTSSSKPASSPNPTPGTEMTNTEQVLCTDFEMHLRQNSNRIFVNTLPARVSQMQQERQAN